MLPGFTRNFPTERAQGQRQQEAGYQNESPREVVDQVVFKNPCSPNDRQSQPQRQDEGSGQMYDPQGEEDGKRPEKRKNEDGNGERPPGGVDTVLQQPE